MNKDELDRVIDFNKGKDKITKKLDEVVNMIDNMEDCYSISYDDGKVSNFSDLIYEVRSIYKLLDDVL